MKQTIACIDFGICILYLSVVCYCSCSHAKCVGIYEICSLFMVFKSDILEENLLDFVEAIRYKNMKT